jgi:hypothetical protein
LGIGDWGSLPLSFSPHFFKNFVIPDKRLKDAKVWNPLCLCPKNAIKMNVASLGHIAAPQPLFHIFS